MTVRQRGQPLIFLAMIVVLWVGARIFAWSGAIPERPLPTLAEAAPPAQLAWGRSVEAPARRHSTAPGFERPFLAAAERSVLRHSLPATPVESAAAPPGLAEEPATVREPPSPPVLPIAAELAQPQTIAAPPTSSRPPRWSGDAWVLVRRGSGPGGAGPGVATYGGNQIGAVLRYRLATGSAHRPTVYLRTSAALNGSGEREAAFGFSVRPVATVPVIVAGEGRVGVLSGKVVARPALMTVTEIPPVGLPGQIRAEFYAQAGYVGGAGATPFADGQLRMDRRIVQAGSIELRAGAGAWGGAQRGAARFDIGPGAAIGVAKGRAAARIGLDWRFRLAGAAQPASGPALTVSAGF